MMELLLRKKVNDVITKIIRENNEIISKKLNEERDIIGILNEMYKLVKETM
jgi:hypothetical protein